MSDSNLSRKEWATYYRNFAKTLEEHSEARRALTDYLVGIGSALDPVPNDSTMTFCQNDMVAFKTDEVKLSLDRHLALKRFLGVREHHGVRPFSGVIGIDKDRDVKAACSLENAT